MKPPEAASGALKMFEAARTRACGDLTVVAAADDDDVGGGRDDDDDDEVDHDFDPHTHTYARTCRGPARAGRRAGGRAGRGTRRAPLS